MMNQYLEINELKNDQDFKETIEEATINVKKSRPISKEPAAEDMNAKKNMDDDVVFNSTPTEMSLKIRGENQTTEKGKINDSQRLFDCLEEQANNSFKLENYVESIDILNEIIERYPDYANVYSNRAVCYLKLEKYKESLEDGRMALVLDGKNFNGLVCIGEAQLALGNPVECLAELETVLLDTANQNIKNLILKARKLSTLMEKAEKAFEENDFCTSSTLYEAVAKIAVKNQTVKQTLIESLVLSGRSLEDVALAQIFLKETSVGSDSFFLKGMIYYYQDKKEEAFENFDKCLAIDNGHERCKELYRKARELYFMKERGNEYFKKKEFELALQAYSNALNVDSKNKAVNATISFNIGVTHLRLFKVTDALCYISAAISLKDNYTKALLKRAEIYLDINQIKDAVIDLEEVCKIKPSFTNKKSHKEALNKLKFAPECQENFCSLEVEEQNKILAVSKKDKGNNFYRNRQYDEALELYLEAITLDPNSPIHYSNRSACHMMMKNYKEAMEDALKSLELDSSFVKGYLRKGRIELVLGKGKEALQSLNQGLELDPKNSSLLEDSKKANKFLEYIMKGEEYFENKNFLEATIVYSYAADIATGCTEILSRKLESLVICGNPFEVQRLLIGLDKDVHYYYISALVNYFLLNKEVVLFNVNMALDFDPNHLKAKRLKSIVLEIDSHWAEAIRAMHDLNFIKAMQFYEQILNIDLDNTVLKAEILCGVGYCYEKQGEFLKAIEYYTSVIESKHSLVKAFLERAKCYNRLNRFEESVKDFEIVFKTWPFQIYKQLLDEAKLKLKKSKRKDYYKVLELNSGATMEDIKNKYLKLSREYHFDRQIPEIDKERREQKFKEISEAYIILSDPLRRERYDKGDEVEDTSNSYPNVYSANSFYQDSPSGEPHEFIGPNQMNQPGYYGGFL